MSSARIPTYRMSNRSTPREAAEALFARKHEVAPKASPATIERRPRVWKVEQAETRPKLQPSAEEQIRTWVKYGLTSSQAAAIYKIPVEEIRRITHRR